MTSKNQIRSVLMTLLMVTSVFAGVVAFSGSAAAEVSDVTVVDQNVVQGGTANVTFTSQTGDNVVLIASTDETYNSGEDYQISSNSSTSPATWSPGTGVDEGSYTIYAANASGTPGDETDLSNWASATSSDTITVHAAGDDGNVKFIGQTAHFQISSGDYELYREDGEGNPSFVTELNQDDNGHISVDTSGRQTGTYYILTDAGADTSSPPASFQLAEQTLNAEFENGNITNAEGDASNNTLTLDSNRNEYQVEVNAGGLDAQELADIFGRSDVDSDEDTYAFEVTSQNAELTADFQDVDADSYNFEFNVVDTDASASEQVNVSNPGDKGATFQPNVVSEQVGDVAAITVNLENSDTAQVTIGDTEEVGYQFNATVNDESGDGQVTLLFNTFEAGQQAYTDADADATDIVSVANDDDSIVDESVDSTQTSGGDPLAPGDYPLSVSIAGDEKNVGTLVLNERSTDSISVWTAPSSADPSNVAELTDAVSNRSEIAQGDYAVVQVQASGIYGYLNNSNLNNTAGDNGLSLYFEQTNAPPNTDGSSFYANDTELIQDPENNTFYALVNTEDIEAGDEFEATFSVNGTNNTYVANDEVQSVSTEFSVAEPEAEFTYNGDQLTLGGSNAQLSGETNLAPGTELNLRVQSNDNSNPFLKTATVEVQQDGTFNGTFDMSGIPQDTEFTASIGELSDVSETGVVGEAPETTQTGTTEGPATQTTETTTEQTTETTTPAPDTTTTSGTETTSNDGGQPGFGIVAALIALIAAALIAVRRD